MIIARHITGKMNTLRLYTRYLLIAIFITVPWLQYNERPAILLDIDARRFFFPGFVIWPQEFYYLMLLLIASGLSLFLFTALWGRIWCGWACPQTVYTELFDDIGRLLFPSRYGKRSERLWNKIVIHSIWILVSFILTFHFIAYFVPARVMLQDIAHGGLDLFANSAWPYFLISMGLIFYSDIGMFREQMCVYVCPYARFQSVMMDRETIAITYDSHRGEPRRQTSRNKILPATGMNADQPSREGDCTSCNMCVLVCPTGIDIRDGLQVSCINCTHCIDACTKEMEKFNKESLINFSSANWFESRIKTRFFRTRTIVYIGLLTLAFSLFGILIANRVPIYFSIVRDPNLLPVNTGTSIQNYYKIGIANLTEKRHSYTVKTRMVQPDSTVKSIDAISETGAVPVDPNHPQTIRYIIEGQLVDGAVPKFRRNIPIEIIIQDKDNPQSIRIRQTLFTIPGA